MTIATLQRGVERYMKDLVVVAHTTAGPVDDAVDPNTLKPIANVGETPVTTYTGKALIVSDAASMSSPDGTEVEVNRYRVLLPAAAPLPAPGDTITMTTAVDPALTAKVLVVESSDASSFNAARVVHARLLAPARPLHGG